MYFNVITLLLLGTLYLDLLSPSALTFTTFFKDSTSCRKHSSEMWWNNRTVTWTKISKVLLDCDLVALELFEYTKCPERDGDSNNTCF